MDMKEVHEILEEWLQKRPAWMSYPLLDIINRVVISNDHIEKYAELCLREADGYEVTKEKVNFQQISTNMSDDKFSIIEISNMKNVNAISSGRTLKLESEGVTVVYGDNGSGKSGYVRAIKKASGVPGCEEIQSNVFRSDSYKQGYPKCSIKLTNCEDIIECDLSRDANPSLQGIKIFDTAISSDYIGKTREASFEPRIFGVLAELATIVDKVKEHLETKYRKNQPEVLNVPDDIINSKVIKNIFPIKADTVLDDDFCLWTESDALELSEAHSRLSNVNPLEKIQNNKVKLKSTERYYNYVEEISEFYSFEKIEKINNIYIRIRELSADYKVLSQQFTTHANDLDQRGLTIDSWRKMWKYANQYLSWLNEFHIDSNMCPLCHQKMEGGTLSRFQTVDEYVSSKISAEISQEIKDYKECVETSFDFVDDQTLRVIFDNCNFGADNESLYLDVVGISGIISNLQKQDLNKAENFISVRSVDFGMLLDSINEHKKLIEFENQELSQLIDGSDLVKQKEIVSELEAKKYISQNHKHILKIIEKHKVIERISKAIKQAQTNAITLLTNNLANDLLSKDYEDKFNKELDLLTAGNLRVKLVKAKGGKGRVPFKFVIEDNNKKTYSPNEILSEGEQRVVSMAAFIADNALGDSTSPLIFDDPISSLDFNYEGATVNRLIELAKSRQIVVFTHRISVVCAICSSCKTASVKFTDVSILSTSHEKGIPAQGILEKKKVKQCMKKLIKTDLVTLKTHDIGSDVYFTHARGLCSRFRETVEKSIEEILLCGITSRFERDIHSKNVNRLKKLTVNDCDIIDNMMSKYSAHEHSNSDETPLRIPDINELETDLTLFDVWVNEASSRLL